MRLDPEARATLMRLLVDTLGAVSEEGAGLAWRAEIENTQPGGRVQMLGNDPDGNTPEFQPATV
jgi:hypothetical protein